MAKLIFLPFSIAAGLLAGILGRKAFDQVWALIDEQEPPDASHRDAEWGKLLLGAALQGAIFRMVKEATDRGSRQGFEALTGSWPGDEAPEPE